MTETRAARRYAGMAIILVLAAASCASQTRGTKEMLPSQIRGKFGPVAGQLLEYSFQETPKGQQTKGQSQAFKSGEGWLRSILNDDIRPPVPPDELIHTGDANTCDAIQHRYQVRGDLGELSIQISQTVFVIAVVVAPSVPPSNWSRDSRQAAMELARRLFRQPERLNLRATDELGWIAMGRQFPADDAPRAATDWLDTIQWWADGTHVGFFLLKRTGPDQSSKPSGSLEANRAWFQMFERPRTR